MSGPGRAALLKGSCAALWHSLGLWTQDTCEQQCKASACAGSWEYLAGCVPQHAGVLGLRVYEQDMRVRQERAVHELWGWEEGQAAALHHCMQAA